MKSTAIPPPKVLRADFRLSWTPGPERMDVAWGVLVQEGRVVKFLTTKNCPAPNAQGMQLRSPDLEVLEVKQKGPTLMSICYTPSSALGASVVF